MRQFKKIVVRTLLALLLLLAGVWIFLETDFGQNWLTRQVTGKLSKDLQTQVVIKHISIGFFNRLDLQGVYIEDQKKDTLLYAGLLKVRITDWFFFKEKAELKYIGLEDATIHINRTDSVWNYGFLASYFAGNPSAPAKPKKASGIEFDLKEIDLKNIHFVKHDAWFGSDLTAGIGELQLTADDISASRKALFLKSVSITNPYFSTLSYAGKAVDTGSTKFDWNVKVASLTVTNGRFRQDKTNYTPTLATFDGSHMDFSAINGAITNVHMQHDTISATADLSLKERSGFTVNKLKTVLTIDPKEFVFDKLLLQTPRTTLADYFAMKFSSTKSFSDFVHAVTLSANFKQSAIASEDLAYFIPAAKDWKKNIKINGKVDGALDGFSSDNLELWLGTNTYINGNLSIVGLPDIKKTLLNIEAKSLNTTYADAVSFFPALGRMTTPNVRSLQYLKFKGTFTGFVNDFVSYGTLQTALGTVTTDINMKLPPGGEPVYSGTISTEGFEVGTFIKSKDLGVVDFHGSVKGRSFNWQKANLNVDGLVHRIRYGGYLYQNIQGKGNITNQHFNGDVTINDPNADLHLNGLVDFSQAVPVFDATAQIRKVNLKALHLTQDDVELKGDVVMNLQGNSVANLLGTARISNAELVANGKKLSFDYLNVASYYIGADRNLTVTSNEFDGKIVGRFDLSTLPSAFRVFLHRYYPAYISAPLAIQPQDFTFDLTTGNVADYLQLVDNHLTGFNNSHIAGALNTTANSMTVDADIPAFTYGQYAFNEVQLKGSGNLEKLTLTGKATNAALGPKVVLPETTFSLSVQNDTSDLVINTISNQVVNRASIAARINTFSDGVAILFNPSSFVLNGKTWSIEQGGELSFRKNSVASGQVLLREGEQEIALQTVPSTDGPTNDLHVALKNLNLADLAPLLLKDTRLEGTLSGTAVVEDPTGNMNITTDLQGAGLRLDNDSLGNVAITGKYSKLTGLLTAKGNNTDPEHKLDFDVAMNLKDSTHAYQDKISLRPTNFQLSYLNRFLGTLFTNITGYTTGYFDILGEGSNRDFIGKLKLTDASMRVLFTQVDYTIENTEIEFRKDYLDLNGIRLHDRKGNIAKITGGFKHHGFKDMDFDLAVQTVSPQMELINTTYKDNQQFYGHAWGSGSFVLLGPQYDLRMEIQATASTTDSSSLTLPPAKTRESGQATFLVEKKYGREMTETEKRGGETNLNYSINVTANPMVAIEVILDETTGDIIHSNGSGNLLITSGTVAPLKINGRYSIAEGSYLFTFQSLLKKPFKLTQGPATNNYIEWNGDPYDATVHLDAYYTAENVSFAPLASTLVVDNDNSRNLARLRANVNVAATLTGKLFAPTFSFKLEFPTNSPIFSQPSIAFAIDQLQRNTNELNKQVTFLIVTNSFAPYESAQNVGTRPFEEFTYSTVSGLLFGEINSQLNQILSRIFRNNKLTLNVSGSLYNRNLLDPNASGFRVFNQLSSNFSVGYSLFSGRAILSVGGNFEVPIANAVQQSVQLLPDVTLEFLVNASGTLRATLYYRQNLDYLSTGSGQATSRYGTSLSYNKEFDSFHEFLFGKKPRKKKAAPPVPSLKPADSTQQVQATLPGNKK